MPWLLGEPCRTEIPPSKLDVSWAAELVDEVHVPGKSSQCSPKVTLAWCEGLPRIVIHQASLDESACMISYGSCSFLSIFPMLAPLVLPNVVPEGVEQAIRRTGVWMPGRVIRTIQYPSLLPCPGICKAGSAEAVCRVGFRVHPLYPYPAAQAEP